MSPREAKPAQHPTCIVYGMVRELALPVARGDLTITEADVALITSATRHCGEFDPIDVARLAQHLLRQRLSREEERRALARHRIRRTLSPMITRHAPFDHLLAEAHGVNGPMDFPLTRQEVTEAVDEQVWWALPPRPMKRRHVR